MIWLIVWDVICAQIGVFEAFGSSNALLGIKSQSLRVSLWEKNSKISFLSFRPCPEVPHYPHSAKFGQRRILRSTQYVKDLAKLINILLKITYSLLL